MEKNRFLFSLMLLFSSMFFCCCSDDNSESGNGQQEVPLPEMIDSEDVCTSMKDPVFMKYCYQNFDINEDKKVSVLEASLAKQIIGDDLEFSDLTGIQYFSGLEVFDVSKGNFTSIDLSCCSNLKRLRIKSPLTQLNLSKNKKLGKVEIYGANISTIDISFLDSLTSFVCNSCRKLSEVTIKYSQLDFCTIDNLKDIHFIIADDPNRVLKRSAKITYSFTESDDFDMVYTSLKITTGDSQYDCGSISNTTYQKVVTFDTLPARSEYVLSSSYTGHTPHPADGAFYVNIYLTYKITVKVDVFLENKLLISSNTYNGFGNSASSSFYVRYSPYDTVKKDLNALVGEYLSNMLASLKCKLIEIDADGTVFTQ